jgi:hypothetical protein
MMCRLASGGKGLVVVISTLKFASLLIVVGDDVTKKVKELGVVICTEIVSPAEFCTVPSVKRVLKLNAVTAVVEGGFLTDATVNAKFPAGIAAVVSVRTLSEKVQGRVPENPLVPVHTGDADLIIASNCPGAGLNAAFQYGKVTSTFPSAPKARVVVRSTVHRDSCPVTRLPGVSEAAVSGTI